MAKNKHWMGMAFLGVLVTVIACRCQPPTPDDIVGIWEKDQDVVDDLFCVSFEFFADGHFDAYNVPSGYFITFPPEFTTIKRVTGLWELGPLSKDMLAIHTVELTFSNSGSLDGFRGSFFIPGAWQGDTIYAGTWDDPIPFVRKTKAECW